MPNNSNIKNITVVPVSVMRTVFPDDIVMQQPYVRDEDWILLRPEAGVKKKLMDAANLNDENARLTDTGLKSPPLHPDIVSGLFPGSISYLRIADDAQQRIREAGIEVTVVENYEQAKDLAMPPASRAGIT
ncbi:MAG: hypothetical protein U1E36_08660 [Rickettsiales bacterium]